MGPDSAAYQAQGRPPNGLLTRTRHEKTTRGSIIKRGNGWLLKYDLGREGRVRRQRYAPVLGTRQDAQRELTRLLGTVDSDTHVDPSTMTLGEYALGWVEGAPVAPKTLERYRELATHQIAPHLGKHKLQKLRPEHVAQWHGTLLKTGLAPRTVQHAHRLLARVLGDAVLNGTISRNVAAIRKAPAVEEIEIEILSPEEVSGVLAKLEGHPLLAIVTLALATGMRRGELLGLQWSDLDLDAGTLRVERSLEETKTGLRLKPPKTKRGRRNIKLPPEAVAVLRAHRVKVMELRLTIGQGAIKSDTLVFGNVEGEPLRPRNVTKTWSRVRQARKLPPVSFHAFRHTHASMLIRAGVDILTVSRRLGHGKASVTLDVYGHIIGGADDAAAAAIEKVLK